MTIKEMNKRINEYNATASMIGTDRVELGFRVAGSHIDILGIQRDYKRFTKYLREEIIDEMVDIILAGEYSFNKEREIKFTDVFGWEMCDTIEFYTVKA